MQKAMRQVSNRVTESGVCLRKSTTPAAGEKRDMARLRLRGTISHGSYAGWTWKGPE